MIRSRSMESPKPLSWWETCVPRHGLTSASKTWCASWNRIFRSLHRLLRTELGARVGSFFLLDRSVCDLGNPYGADAVLFQNSVERSYRFSVVMAEDSAESFAPRDRG